MQDLWLQILLTALNAVLSIILMIALGYILRQKKMLSESFLTIGNKLVFKLCLPTMLFVNIYGVASLSDIRWDVVLYSAVALLVVHWLRICLSMQGMLVRSLVGELRSHMLWGN